MRIVDRASFEEYVRWYLQRDYWKRGRPDPLRIDDIDWCMREMYTTHLERMRPDFAQAEWSRVVVSSVDEMRQWLAPDYKWLQAEGLIPPNNDRTLGALANQAVFSSFFTSKQDFAPLAKRMYSYYRMLQDDQLRFSGINRVVLFQDYGTDSIVIYDGIGRVLPMLTLAINGGRVIPIEAYYADIRK